jgi:hypothetical protein
MQYKKLNLLSPLPTAEGALDPHKKSSVEIVGYGKQAKRSTFLPKKVTAEEIKFLL